MSVQIQKQNHISLDMTVPPSLPNNVQTGSNTTAKTKISRLVRTEFVFPASTNHSTIHVCGDWSEWHPIPMSLEKGKHKVILWFFLLLFNLIAAI